MQPKGYSYRAAGAVLGVHFVHLFRVLSGDRDSASLLARVAALPPLTAPVTPPRPVTHCLTFS